MPEHWASGAICEDLPGYTVHAEQSMRQVCMQAAEWSREWGWNVCASDGTSDLGSGSDTLAHAEHSMRQVHVHVCMQAAEWSREWGWSVCASDGTSDLGSGSDTLAHAEQSMRQCGDPEGGCDTVGGLVQWMSEAPGTLPARSVVHSQ